MDEHDGLRLAVIPLFFGCGLLWSEERALGRRGRRDRRALGPQPDPRARRERSRHPARAAALARAGDRRPLRLLRQAGGGDQADRWPRAPSGRSSRSPASVAAASRRSRGRSSRSCSPRARRSAASISADGSAAPSSEFPSADGCSPRREQGLQPAQGLGEPPARALLDRAQLTLEVEHGSVSGELGGVRLHQGRVAAGLGPACPLLPVPGDRLRRATAFRPTSRRRACGPRSSRRRRRSAPASGGGSP